MTQSRASERLAHEILAAYPLGLFPMAESRDSEEYNWYRPEARGIIPLHQVHISKSLWRYVRQNADRLSFSYDTAFETVIDACAARDETWISGTIRDAFILLHENDYTHSAEVYLDDQLIGGVYGLALGGAFFGESMFSRSKNGSKLALIAMVNDLQNRGFALYDTQFLTPHLASLGGIEIDETNYEERLNQALNLSPKPIQPGRFEAIDYFLPRCPQL